MSGNLEQRIARLEQQEHGAGRMIVVTAAAEAEDRQALVERVLSEAGIVGTDRDLVVTIKHYGGPADYAKLINVQEGAGR